jgi:phage replication-related protein YjqB (UPF0714/DUF867 family)
MDRYSSFAELRAVEPNGSFEISHEERPGSQVIVIAPHGGKIEALTSEIALQIAGNDFSYYSFAGKKHTDNRDLHITSRRFDEPLGVALVAKYRWVLAIHGCSGDAEQIYLGGLDTSPRVEIASRLMARGIDATMEGHRYPGQDPANICNRGLEAGGVQLELTMPFRESDAVRKLVDAVREALFHWTDIDG